MKIIKQYLKRRRILLVDDNKYFTKTFANYLRDCGARVLCAHSFKGALNRIQDSGQPLHAALMEIYLPKKNGQVEHPFLGIDLADRLVGFYRRPKRGRRPLIIAISAHLDDYSHQVLEQRFDAFFQKEPLHYGKLFMRVGAFIEKAEKGRSRNPVVFIVHGQDNETKLSVKNYLQNVLDLGEPIILHERPGYGRTIIEKFEKETQKVDLVFVILTPDDKGCLVKSSDRVKRRARQNVIFELGFFYAKLQRTSGRVILLTKGNIEIPSDISGIAYIDISKGIEAASDQIRREVSDWIQRRPNSSGESKHINGLERG